MANTPTPRDNEVVISRDIEFEGYYDTYAVTKDANPNQVDNLHEINWPNTHNNESTDISSFQLGTAAKITVFSEYDCNGTSETFLKSERNLKKKKVTINGKETTWDDNIKSFKLELI